MSPFAVRIAADEADRKAAFAVRREVFVVEQGVPEDLEYDAYDAPPCTSSPSAGTTGPRSAPVGCCIGPDAAGRTGGAAGVGSLGRLAVTRAARGLGVGAALVRGIEDAARARGLTAVDLHAQTHALRFYERLGYVAYGGEFLDAGMPHRAMRRTL